MNKKIIYNEKARTQLKKGVDAVGNAVKVTLGAKGRNVIISKHYGSPAITKDGVTVAKEIFLEDPIQNMGAQMIKDVASKTADLAGDGTTTATVLAQIIIAEGLKNVTAGANPMSLKKGIDKAVLAVSKHLKGQAVLIGNDNKNVENIATISANNDNEIGKLIAQGIKKVGKDGVITIEESKNMDTYVEVVDGMQLDRGWLTPYFMTNPIKQDGVLEKPYILLTDKKLSAYKEIVPLLEKVALEGRAIFIIADDVEGESFAFLVSNKMDGKLKTIAIKTPAFGVEKSAIMEDIAAITGGMYFTEARGYRIEDITLDQLGQANKVIVNKNSTVIQDGAGEKKAIQERILTLRTQLKENPNMSTYEKEKIMKRIGKLNCGIGIIFVGGTTEVEMKEKKDRVDDALHATKAALEEGIIAGGGVGYIRALSSLEKLKGINEDENTGISIIRKALEEPLRQMVNNSGSTKAEIVIEKVKEGKKDFGYNCLLDKYENLIEAGVVDPTKVARIALENAASIAGLLLTTECLICDIDKPKQN